MQPRPGDPAVDLCSGCGIVALAWHDAGHRGPCAAVERSTRRPHALCRQSVAANGPEAAHIRPVLGDLRRFALSGPDKGSCAVVACNPPYFTGGLRSPDARRAAARHDDLCTTADVAACAARLLRSGGKLALCQRPEQIGGGVCRSVRRGGWSPKRLAAGAGRARPGSLAVSGGGPEGPPAPACAGSRTCWWGRGWAYGPGRSLRRMPLCRQTGTD